MKIKQLSICLLSTLFLASCGEGDATKEENKTNAADTTTSIVASTGQVNIQGKIENAANITIKLYDYTGSQPMAIDSTTTDAEGKFSFSKAQNGFNFIGVGETPMTAALVVAESGSNIEISGSRENWIQDYQVLGSTHSGAMKEYFVKRQEYSAGIQNLKAEMNAISKDDQKSLDAINEQGMAMQASFETYKYDFINKNINSPAVYAAFQDIYDLQKDEAILKEMSATMSKYMPNSVFAQGVEQRYLQAVQMNQQATPAPVQTGNLSVGSVAPELNFPGLDGKNISLHSLKGKVVLLDFWASWCGPCRKENPNVVKLYNEYKDKGFTIYSFSLDQDKNKWANAITKDGLIWPYHASDLKGWQSAGGAIYGVNSIPQTYLIGADGKIIAAGLRGIDLENKLKEILG